ncbi:hypothetical protein BDY24DRAFT_327620, partial [Mrakia frigida]|uniref:uncharacterized protein n=1 Tax=Mrakia frigida TaxID=29902 RepID=UPI003FCC11ED
LGLIQWGVQHHLRTKNGLFFVDDVFGSDISGATASRSSLGESHLLPRDQWTTLAIWDFISLPWRWKKQINNLKDPKSLVTILGFDVNGETLEVSLSLENRRLLSDRILAFVKEPKQPLKEWRRLLGWMSWSLNVDPLLKPLLSSSYEKILEKNHENAPIFLNQAVTNNLSVFANEILVSRPLHLLDPGVVEWNNNEAD